jgi:hypothetical protein
MKKLLLQAICLFAFISTQAQIANGDFEDWTKLIFFDQPYVGVQGTSSNFESYFADGTLNVTEIPREDGSAMRLENVSVDDEVIPGYFMTGGMPTQEGETIFFEGGFPITDSDISGISFDARFNLPAESPGFVIVQFKNGNTLVGTGNMGPGTFVFQMSGDVSDWNLMTFEFDTPVSTEANTCVIGFAAADVLANDQNFIAGAFLEIDNVSLDNSTNIIQGAAFENWIAAPPIYTPDDVLVDIIPFADHYSQTNEANNGAHALELKTISHQGQVIIGTVMMAEEIDGLVVPNIEIAEGQQMLEFYYKYVTEGEDMATAEIVFYQTTEEESIPVYMHTIDLTPSEDYMLMNYDFGADLQEAEVSANKMSIKFSSSSEAEGHEPLLGSTLTVDDVALSEVLSDFVLTSAGNTPQIVAYPNPTYGRVIFNFGAQTSGFYRFYSPQGSMLSATSFSNKTQVIHDLWGLPAGQYIFRFYTPGLVRTKYVVKL